MSITFETWMVSVFAITGFAVLLILYWNRLAKFTQKPSVCASVVVVLVVCTVCFIIVPGIRGLNEHKREAAARAEAELRTDLPGLWYDLYTELGNLETENRVKTLKLFLASLSAESPKISMQGYELLRYRMRCQDYQKVEFDQLISAWVVALPESEK